MVRDDLYITVPNSFRCPISLDVMKSPVSLSTGVTYDRDSIQRWLDTGANTCPATMQVLKNKEFVPNRTLQRLIQIWSDSTNNRVDSLESRERVTELIKDLERRNGDSVDLLSQIVCFAEEFEENRKFLARIDGFVVLLVDLISNVDGGVMKNVDVVELVVRILDFVVQETKDYEQLSDLALISDRDCLSSLLLVLQQGSVESRSGSARLLESMAIDAKSKLMIAEKEGILSELLKSIKSENDPIVIEATLSCLIKISSPRRIKLKLHNHGAIKTLTDLLSNSKSTVTEKVLKLLEMLSTCKEARTEICETPPCVAAIVQQILKVSSTATEHAVTTVWSVCCVFREQKAVEAVAKSNGLTKILVVMQSNCSPPVRQMCTDLLKIFRVHSKSCLYSYDTKATHIMPF